MKTASRDKGEMLQDLFKVETLDVRFASVTGEPLPSAQKSKWNTKEYYLYYLAFAIIPIFMVKSVVDISQPSHPGYKHYEHLLSPGWIPGRKVDISDAQYNSFRDNIPYMALLLILHPLCRRAYEAVTRPSIKSGEATSPQAVEARFQSRVSFDFTFALIFLFVLHGVSALKVLTILWLNYQITTALPKKYVGVTTWVFNLATLFANELGRGYRLADIESHWFPNNVSGLGARIDSFGGIMPRWEVLFNITVLRLISFNFDHLWMLDRRSSSPVEKKNLNPAALPERERVSLGANPTDFTFRNYIAYVLYSPLYLIGPIINFNDYISQSRHPLPSASHARIIPYLIRFLFCLLTMEIVIHYTYAVAISKASPDWHMYSPFQLSMLGYFTLHHIWLKLLIPWRFFRLWALVDGIDPPENMVRCMSDNYSTLAFWRGWHRSYNRFVVRYIYIPLGGGGKTKIHGMLNFLAVFTFVAVWHDINLRLLAWGWLITVFVLPEVIATLLFPAKKWRDRPNTYRWLCALGAVANILMMMVANLVGFAIGVDGLKGLIDGIVNSFGGRAFVVGACSALFIGTQVMFEWRESEKRRGVNMKC